MSETLQKVFDALKSITVYQLIIAIMTAAPTLTGIYYFSKPIAVSAASTAITRIMIAQGIDPQQFKEIPKKVEQQGQAQTRIESDLATIKAQQQLLLDLLKKEAAKPSAPQPEQ